MKKVLCVILAIVMAFSSFAVINASAVVYLEGYTTENPSLYIRGNGYPIYDSEGNCVYDFDVTSDQIKAIAEDILPLFFKGYLTGDYTEYYETTEKDFAELYDKCSLDENGNAKYGTNVKDSALNARYWDMHVSRANEDGTFQFGRYQFCHDWRLDPMENASILNDYINGILETTGKEKVSISCDCLGGVVILAYLAEYGHDKIEALSFESTVAFGSELVDDTFSGNINVDPDALTRFLDDEYLSSSISEDYKDILELVQVTAELAKDNGSLGVVTDAFMTQLYDKLYETLVPTLCMASYGSWLSYWALVTPENYESTRDFVFGQEGSERYEKYRTFIEKLDNYDQKVRQHIPELLQSAKDDGVNLAIITKYGFQYPPVLQSTDKQCDIWTSVEFSSLGATAAPIGSTLSDDYIAQREAEGLSKYISPDNIIDASTCLFPDNTFFIKNAMHNESCDAIDMIAWECATCKGEFSVENSTFTQFMLYDRETETLSELTADNCHTESWYEEPEEELSGFAAFMQKIKNFFSNIRKWFSTLYTVLNKYVF